LRKTTTLSVFRGKLFQKDDIVQKVLFHTWSWLRLETLRCVFPILICSMVV
ncbi:hypothetical protein glysoja_012648, partial [Glycine soja]